MYRGMLMDGLILSYVPYHPTLLGTQTSATYPTIDRAESAVEWMQEDLVKNDPTRKNAAVHSVVPKPHPTTVHSSSPPEHSSKKSRQDRRLP